MTMPADQCQAKMPEIKTKAEACLQTTDFNARLTCFNEVHTNYNSYLDGCGQQFVQPLHDEIASREKSLYSNQASALDGGGGNSNGNMQAGNKNNNNGGGNRGRGNKGSSGPNNGQNNNQGNNKQGSNWTPEKCQAEASNLPSQAAECLKVSDFNARRGCFQTLGNSHPNDFYDACRTQIDPIKNQAMSQEKTQYPDQASAVDGDGSGNNNNGNSNNNQQANNGGSRGNKRGGKGNQSGPNGQNGGQNNNGGNNGNQSMTMPADQCQAKMPEIKTKAEACLQTTDFNARLTCFNEVHTNYNSYLDGCSQQFIQPLHDEIASHEKSLYPNQASALDGNHSGGGSNGNQQANNNNNNNNGGGKRGRGNKANGSNGNQGNNQPPAGNWTPEMCQEQIPRLQKAAENCLNVSTQTTRASCFQSVGTQFPNGFMDSCKAQTDVVKSQITAQEKAKYPDQATAIPDDHGGGGGGQNGPNGQQNGKPGRGHGHEGRGTAAVKDGAKPAAGNVDCEKVAADIRKAGMKCIDDKKYDKFEARKKCFDIVGSKNERSGKMDACKDSLQPLKNDLMAAEKAKHPDQENALQ